MPFECLCLQRRHGNSMNIDTSTHLAMEWNLPQPRSLTLFPLNAKFDSQPR